MRRGKVKFSAVETGYIVRWVEADVAEVDVLEDDTIYRRQTCRVFGMNAPEPRGITKDAAFDARKRANELTNGLDLRFVFLQLPESFLIPPRFKQYGRTMMRVFLPCDTEICVRMVDEGFAVPYFMGLGRLPNPLEETRGLQEASLR